MNALDTTDAQRVIGDILELHAQHGVLAQDALLPVLHAIQDRLGFIPPDAVEGLAQAFNLSRAEVHGVITFYHYFKTTPPARCTVQVCRAEACQSMGGDALLSHVEQALGCALHAHTADGGFALEPVYCLGHCATAPAIMINDAVHAKVTPARFDKLVAKVATAVTTNAKEAA